MEIAGWKIYQLSYDESKGRWSDISVFELVRDPWLPVVYAGIIMMMLGAICLFVNAQKRKEEDKGMSWEHFIWFAIAALICWSLGAFAAWKGKKPVWTYGFTLLGLVIFSVYLRYGFLWNVLRCGRWERHVCGILSSFHWQGLITYVRWKYKWIFSFSCILSLVFICINIFKPEIHNKTLMPALQSPWFAPHVIVYMFAYAMLGAAVVMAVYLLWFKKKDIERKRWTYAIT